MKSLVAIFVILSAIANAELPPAAAGNASDIQAVYLEAHDGDTIKVKIANLPKVFSLISVRVKGIDTAEMTSKLTCERHLAEMAKVELSALFAENEVVTLRNCEKDKYFRLLCDVSSAKSPDVGKSMLAHGLAHAYYGKTKAPFVCSSR